MKLFPILTILTLLVLVRSTPVLRRNESICEFFKNIEDFNAEQWENSVNLFKTLLGKTINASSAYPEYTAYLQDYLDRGKSIDLSTSVQEKMEYFEGFTEYEHKPTLDATSENGKELLEIYDSFETRMRRVLLKFYTKYTKARQDMFGRLDDMREPTSGELFVLLAQYPPEYRGPRDLGFRILAFKNEYPCV